MGRTVKMFSQGVIFLIILFLISLLLIISTHPSFQKQSSSGIGAKDLLGYFKKEEYKRSATVYACLDNVEYRRPKLARLKHRKT